MVWKVRHQTVGRAGTNENQPDSRKSLIPRPFFGVLYPRIDAPFLTSGHLKFWLSITDGSLWAWGRCVSLQPIVNPFEQVGFNTIWRIA